MDCKQMMKILIEKLEKAETKKEFADLIINEIDSVVRVFSKHGITVNPHNLDGTKYNDSLREHLLYLDELYFINRTIEGNPYNHSNENILREDIEGLGVYFHDLRMRIESLLNNLS